MLKPFFKWDQYKSNQSTYMYDMCSSVAHPPPPQLSPITYEPCLIFRLILYLMVLPVLSGLLGPFHIQIQAASAINQRQ